MTLFEYVSVAVSIVVAIGATHLLGSIRGVLYPGRRYWVHVVWVGVILLAYAQLWWSFWGLRDLANWNFGSFVYVLLGPGLLFVCSTALVPRSAPDRIEWEAHFFEVRVFFFATLSLYTVWAMTGSWLMAGVSVTDPYRLIQVAFLALAVFGVLASRREVHGVVAVLAALMFVAGQATFRLLPPNFAAAP